MARHFFSSHQLANVCDLSFTPKTVMLLPSAKTALSSPSLLDRATRLLGQLLTLPLTLSDRGRTPWTPEELEDFRREGTLHAGPIAALVDGTVNALDTVRRAVEREYDESRIGRDAENREERELANLARRQLRADMTTLYQEGRVPALEKLQALIDELARST